MERQDHMVLVVAAVVLLAIVRRLAMAQTVAPG
jgi:hypothetical protein